MAAGIWIAIFVISFAFSATGICPLTLRRYEKVLGFPKNFYDINFLMENSTAKNICLPNTDNMVIVKKDTSFYCTLPDGECRLALVFNSEIIGFNFSDKKQMPYTNESIAHNEEQLKIQLDCLLKNYSIAVNVKLPTSTLYITVAFLQRFYALNEIPTPTFLVEMRPKFQFRANLTFWPDCSLTCTMEDTVKSKTFPNNYNMIKGVANDAEDKDKLRWATTSRGKLRAKCWSDTASLSPSEIIGEELSYHGEAMFVYIYLRTNTNHRTALYTTKQAECVIRMDFVSESYKKLPYKATLIVGTYRTMQKNLKGNHVISMVMNDKFFRTHIVNMSCCIRFDNSINYCKIIPAILYSSNYNFFGVEIVSVPHVDYLTIGSLVRCHLKFVRNDEVRQIVMECKNLKGKKFYSKNEMVHFDSYQLLLTSTTITCHCKVMGALHDSEAKRKFQIFVEPRDIEVNTTHWTLRNTTTFNCKGKGYPLHRIRWRMVLKDEQVEHQTFSSKHYATLTIIKTPNTPPGKIIAACSVEVFFQGASYMKESQYTFFLEPPHKPKKTVSKSMEQLVWSHLGYLHITILIFVCFVEFIRVLGKMMMSRMEPTHGGGGQLWRKGAVTLHDGSKPSSVHLMSMHSSGPRRRQRSLDHHAKLDPGDWD